jgi:integrase
MENSFKQLASDTLSKIKGFGIKSKSVIKGFKRTCRLLNAYLEAENLEFSLTNGQKWLSKAYPVEPITPSQRVVYLGRRRAIYLLADNTEGKLENWRIYPNKTAARPQTSGYINLLRAHEMRMQTDGMAKTTISFAMRVGSDFLIYLERNGKIEINEVTPHEVTGYFAQDYFAVRKPDGVKAYAYRLKSFLVFLEDTCVVTDMKLSLAVPKVFAKQESIVTVLSDKIVNALRNKENGPDTDTFTRDHAMMLLALRLGIRRSDIHKMKLGNIDWKNDNISFIQQKTGVPITLPLLPDVGNALMDYILNYRPESTDDAIFTRYYAPHRALTMNTNIVEKCIPDINPEDSPERGYHILRRTFSTKMLRNNIPRSIISASIGQTDPDSINVYLSADEENMRKCAISLNGIECTRGDLS